MRMLAILGLGIVIALFVALWRAESPRAQRPERGETIDDPAPEPVAPVETTDVACEVSGVEVIELRVYLHVHERYVDEAREETKNVRFLFSEELIRAEEYIVVTGPPFRIPVPNDIVHAELLVLAEGCRPAMSEYLDPGFEDEEESGISVELEPAKPWRVTVRDRDGAPIPGARVLVKARTYMRPFAEGRSGRDGSLTVHPTKEGDLVALKPGYTRGHVDSDKAEIILERAFRMAGKVVDTAGKPIAAVAVTLKEGWGDVVRSAFEPTIRTDAEGRFSFEHVSHGDCTLYFRVRGYVDGLYTGWPGDESIEVILHRASRLRCLVVDGAGGPVVGAGIDVRYPEREDLYLGVNEEGKTDEQGRLTLDQVAPGPWLLQVDNGECEGELPIEVGEGATGDYVIRTKPKERPESTLRLRVTDHTGRPLVGASVTVYRAEGETDSNGRVELSVRVEPGKTLRALIIPLALTSRNHPYVVDVVTDAPMRTVALPETVEATIRLVSGAHPSAKVELEFSGFMRVVRQDPGTGVYVFMVNPAMEYELRASSPGHADIDARWRLPPSRETVVRLEPLGSLEVVLADAEGKPAKDAWLRIFYPARDPEESAYVVRSQAQWDIISAARARPRFPKPVRKGGRAIFEGLAPGTLVLAAGRREGLPEVSTTIRIESAKRTVLRYVLGGYALFEGRVTDASGRPLGGVAVHTAERPRGYNPDKDSTATRSDGRFSIRLRKRDPHWLMASRFKYGTVLFKPGTISEIRLPRAGALALMLPGQRGWIRYQREYPIAGGGGRFLPGGAHVSYGHLHIESVAAGTFRLRIDGRVHAFEIRAGETTKATLK